MIIIMQKQAADADIAAVVSFIRARGLQEHVSRGQERTIIGAVGDERVLRPEEITALPMVERAVRVLDDWRIIGREAVPEDSVITVRGVSFGGPDVLDIAVGAAGAAEADAVCLDPFFLPDSPYSGETADESRQIRTMRADIAACHAAGRPVLLRIRDTRQIAAALEADADILFLGGGLMHNRALLEEIGRLNTPVVLCKDKHHSYSEHLTAAEHIAIRGNSQIILGETGTLAFSADFPHRLDIESLVRSRQLCRLPVLADISRLHHKGMPQEVLYRLAVAAGACAVVGTSGRPPAA